MRLRAKVMAIAALVASPVHGSGQHTPLVSSLERLAETNNAEAIYYLGMAYHTGSGVPQDLAKALAAFRKAAALGDPLASYKLGCYYAGQGSGLLLPDDRLALQYKLVAAKAGYALAEQDVGILYAQGGDVATGLVWLEKSAAQGWSGGLMALASAYNGAFGVPPDAARTAAYFSLVLARSEPSAQQAEWLRRFEKQLTPADKKRAESIVRSYHPKPTQLTLKALSGQRAAQALVQTTLVE